MNNDSTPTLPIVRRRSKSTIRINAPKHLQLSFIFKRLNPHRHGQQRRRLEVPPPLLLPRSIDRAAPSASTSAVHMINRHQSAMHLDRSMSESAFLISFMLTSDHIISYHITSHLISAQRGLDRFLYLILAPFLFLLCPDLVVSSRPSSAICIGLVVSDSVVDGWINQNLDQPIEWNEGVIFVIPFHSIPSV